MVVLGAVLVLGVASLADNLDAVFS
jgi:hypothetical protein